MESLPLTPLDKQILKENLEMQEEIANLRLVNHQWKKEYEKSHAQELKLEKAMPLIRKHYPLYENSQLKVILESDDG